MIHLWKSINKPCSTQMQLYLLMGSQMLIVGQVWGFLFVLQVFNPQSLYTFVLGGE